MLAKARVAWSVTAEDGEHELTGPDLDPEYGRLEDYRLIWFLLKDLERLAARRKTTKPRTKTTKRLRKAV